MSSQPENSTPVRSLSSQLQPYVEALLGASGLSEFDAVTSVLYAIATHLDLEEYPLLVYQGVAGSGKSSAMKQLFPMCKGSEWIRGKTPAAQQRELKLGVSTAFVEEGDKIDNDLYTCRFSKQTGEMSINEPDGAGWKLTPYNIFGATVLHRRVSIGDVGLRSRSIVIRTKFKPDNYQIRPIGDVSMIALKLKQAGAFEYNRIWQTWSPLITIGAQLGMTDWLQQATKTIDRETENLRGGQGFEPSEAILRALDILSRKESVNHERTDKTVRVSEIVVVVRDEFAIYLRPYQITQEITTGEEFKGLEVVTLHGYPAIKISKGVLDKLLP